jgi:1,2-diacylglycerol 3-alpha-glucosyltransferase
VRVLFISDVYFPRVNGVSTSVRTFRQDLADGGVETLLVAPDYAEANMEPDVFRVSSAGVPGDPEDRRMRWGVLTRVLENLRGADIDLVHIHTPFIAHYAGVRFARRAGLPCIATYHTFFEEYLHHYVPALPRRFGRALARSFTRSQCREVQALIAPSDPMRDILLEYGVTTPIHVLPTGLPRDRFQAGQGERFRALIGLPADRPLVTYVGRVAHEKNIEFLIDAFIAVRRSVPRAMFVIAGEGPARESLQQRVARAGIQDDVRFVGYLDRNSALLDCYAAADVFVFASRTETQGLVLLEAMAQGTAVVSTAELGTRSILKEGCGALVVAERVEEFSAGVAKLLQDAPLRRALSMQGQEYARTWASHVMAQRLKDLYASLCAADASRYTPPSSNTRGRERIWGPSVR